MGENIFVCSIVGIVLLWTWYMIIKFEFTPPFAPLTPEALKTLKESPLATGKQGEK